jgi:hypothetical protein
MKGKIRLAAMSVILSFGTPAAAQDMTEYEICIIYTCSAYYVPGSYLWHQCRVWCANHYPILAAPADDPIAKLD